MCNGEGKGLENGADIKWSKKGKDISIKRSRRERMVKTMTQNKNQHVQKYSRKYGENVYVSRRI